MAVFPKRPDFTSVESIKDYLLYMIERLEFTIAKLEKELHKEDLK